MDNRIYNFSAGPAMLPTPVLTRAKEELLSFGGSGMSVMEFSHRSKQFAPVLAKAESGIRRLLNIPENYKVLFLHGGTSLQFAMIPMNFLKNRRAADYIVTGAWGKKAVGEAKRAGEVNVIYDSEETDFTTIPLPEELRFTDRAAYVHYTSNETIDGVEFKYDLDADGIPVVCDASSNILSKSIDLEKYALIYAGAAKEHRPKRTCLSDNPGRSACRRA